MGQPSAADLLRDRVWWRWTVSVGATRLPPAIAPLALLFFGREATDGYAGGAVLSGTYALSEALFAAWQGRRLDRLPLPRRSKAIRRSLFGASGLLLAVSLSGDLHAPLILLAALTAGAAAAQAGVQGGYRALLVNVLEPGLHQRAFSWDAAILELEWLVAPVIVSAALAVGDAGTAVDSMCASSLTAAGLTYLTPRPKSVDTPHQQPSEPGAAAGLRGSGILARTVPVMLVSVGLGIGEGGLVTALPALVGTVGGPESSAGLFAAVLAAASALGGVGLGALGEALPGAPKQQAAVGLILMSSLLLPAALSSSVWVLLAPLVAGGLLIAPINALRTRALELDLPQSLQNWGFSLLYGINGLGTAAGSSVVAATIGLGSAAAVVTVLGLALACGAAASVWAARSRA